MRRGWIFTILVILVILLALANILFGAVHIDAAKAIGALIEKDPDDPVAFIIRASRLPACATALLAGSALGVAGLMLQTFFRNPLAGPSILGISSGASLGVAVVVLLFGGSISLGFSDIGGTLATIGGAVVGSLAVTGLLILFSTFIHGNLMLLITGIMIGYLASSLVTLLSSFATAEGIQGYVLWGMGCFTAVSSESLPVFAILTILGLAVSLTLSKSLNLLLMGYDYAANLGVNIRTVRNILLGVSSMLAAVVTAWCGPISFIGLTIPHIARLLMRTDNHRVLFPATMLCGAAVALACNVASTAIPDVVIPINALTPLFGVPVILYVLICRR